MVSVGQKYKQLRDPRLYHLCAIIDGGKAVVLKFYGIHKQYWHYEVTNTDAFEHQITKGLYKLVKRSNR